MFRYARRRGLSHADAEDVVQQCMSALTRALPHFEYTRQRGGFKGWLHTVVDNTVKNHFRKSPMPRADTDRLAAALGREDSPAELWESHWEEEHLLYCLEQCRREVTDQTYEAFRLYVLEEQPPEKVAEELGISVDKVYRAKSRVLDRVREKMTETLAAVQ
jgi:RNA polymerase sigma-70 factor (ECF subfamily)